MLEILKEAKQKKSKFDKLIPFAHNPSQKYTNLLDDPIYSEIQCPLDIVKCPQLEQKPK